MTRRRVLISSFLSVLFLGGLVRGQAPVQEAAPEVAYSHDIAPLVASYCTTCHRGKDPSAGLVLDSYDAVKDEVESGELLARIHDELDPMPPVGRMSSRQRQLFEDWKEGGYVKESKDRPPVAYEPFVPPVLAPIRAEEGGMELLEKLQGHWVGSMNLMGQPFPWFAWDFRAIGPAHMHGIFEGGTLGNLFTSFFVADLRGTRTVMARNGGLLNGIYRTSYFVLDRVERAKGAEIYRLVDAYGGEGVMWMTLTFRGDRLEFEAHTSRMGMAAPPKRHMLFKGRRLHPELAEAAAKGVGFPKLEPERSFPEGLPLPDWGAGVPVTSYSYIWEDDGLDVTALGRAAGDPIRIDQMPHVGGLSVTIDRPKSLKEVPLEVYLSREPLTDAKGKLRMKWGMVDGELYDGLLMFPELSAGEDRFTFTYLHPGRYFLVVVADVNGDGYASKGDVTSRSVEVVVPAGETVSAEIRDLDVKN